jgi:hypothetical protein
MSTVAKKRIGRPRKAPKPGARAPLSLLVRPQLKRRIEKLAAPSGATMSAEAERLLEKALAYDDVLAAMGATLPELRQRNAEANFRERGYTVIRSPHGDIWLPPGHPDAPPPSGFIPPKEESAS